MNAHKLGDGTVHKLPADFRKSIALDIAAAGLWADITPLARNEWICWVISPKQEAVSYTHLDVYKRQVDASSQLVLSALLGAIVWNLLTWWFGLPSSSSHALIGGLCGAALSASHMNWNSLIWVESAADWTKSKGLGWKVMVPMVTSPLVGFLLGVLLMTCLLYTSRCV